VSLEEGKRTRQGAAGRLKLKASRRIHIPSTNITPPGTPRSRSLVRFTMRVGLPHLGQFVDLVVSSLFCGQLFCDLCHVDVLGPRVCQTGRLKMIAGVPSSSSLHESREVSPC